MRKFLIALACFGAISLAFAGNIKVRPLKGNGFSLTLMYENIAKKPAVLEGEYSWSRREDSKALQEWQSKLASSIASRLCKLGKNSEEVLIGSAKIHFAVESTGKLIDLDIRDASSPELERDIRKCLEDLPPLQCRPEVGEEPVAFDLSIEYKSRKYSDRKHSKR